MIGRWVKEREGQRGRESHFGKCVEASGALGERGVVALFGFTRACFARWLTAYRPIHLACSLSAAVAAAASSYILSPPLAHEPSSLDSLSPS